VTSLHQIRAIIREYPARYQPVQIEPLGAAGGMSGALFWRIHSASGPLVLRRWPSEHSTAERLQFIHEVLFHTAGREISFLPVPIRTSADRSFVAAEGHLWELAPWMPGAADYERSPSMKRLNAAMSALATFHVAASDFPATTPAPVNVTAPAITRRLSTLRELADHGAGNLFDRINFATWPEFDPLVRRFLTTVPKLLPRTIVPLETLANLTFPLQPCIRDIWHDHVLFTRDEVTGIIDFGAVGIDTPATDLARLLGSLVGDDEAAWRAGISAYSDTRPFSVDEERAARALDASSTILAGCNWIRWIGSEGRQFEDRSRVIKRFRQIVARCEFAAATKLTAPGSAGGSPYQ